MPNLLNRQPKTTRRRKKVRGPQKTERGKDQEEEKEKIRKALLTQGFYKVLYQNRTNVTLKVQLYPSI